MTLTELIEILEEIRKIKDSGDFTVVCFHEHEEIDLNDPIIDMSTGVIKL
jgi:excinuclease UvrABC ATPase subunit